MFNIGGMALYLYLASSLWVRPGEEGTPGGPGDAFYWLFILVPTLGAFLLIDLVALLAILFERRGKALTKALVIWGTIAALWAMALAFDHHKAFRIIDSQYSRLTMRSTRTQPQPARSFHPGNPVNPSSLISSAAAGPVSLNR
jgi:hypothetical protein